MASKILGTPFTPRCEIWKECKIRVLTLRTLAAKTLPMCEVRKPNPRAISTASFYMGIAMRKLHARDSTGVIALILAVSILLLACPAFAQTANTRWAVVDIAVPGQGTQRALYASAAQPRLTAILLTGSDGVLTFGTDGNPSPGGNFLVRTRDQWTQQGFAVILLGSPGDVSLLGRRHLPSYAAALDSALDYARRRNSAPVWLIGTSQGTIGAVNGAAHLRSKVAGVVLTSSVTQQGASGETVFDADPGSIAVPALVVGNARDTCHESPPGDMSRLLAALTEAPGKEIMVMQSSDIRSGPCEGKSPHGYLGIEDAVVQQIAAWMRRVEPTQGSTTGNRSALSWRG
jgi:pimeloyl-ACP methyl ester carboxylesterase